MTPEAQIALVEDYFRAVDTEDLPALVDMLAPACLFRVETHDVTLQGQSEISAMFSKLWADHAAVRHHSFEHVTDTTNNRIASRFTVENTEHDGSLTHKSNCNFFDISGGKFSTIRVYMAGANTLHATK